MSNLNTNMRNGRQYGAELSHIVIENNETDCDKNEYVETKILICDDFVYQKSNCNNLFFAVLFIIQFVAIIVFGSIQIMQNNIIITNSTDIVSKQNIFRLFQ